jgi:hypothetical protein
MELVTRLDDWFAERLRGLNCGSDTRAYVVGVLSGHIDDMSDESVVLAYQDASLKGNFATFQRIGDWTLWVSAFAPHPLKGQRDVVERFGRLSYYACYRIMRGQWRLYEELADELPRLTWCVRKEIQGARVIAPGV